MSGAVIPFPGNPLVAVVSEAGCHSVMLAKIGATAAERQVTYATLAEAEESAREGAELCRWRYVGVIDEYRRRRIAEFGGVSVDDDDGGAAA